MMQRYGKIIFAMLVIGMMTTAANAATLIDYWTFDETTGTNFANEIESRPSATMVNFEGDEWSTDVPTALTHSTGSLKFDNQCVSTGQPGGVGEHLFLAARSDYDGSGSTGFSISMWIKPMSSWCLPDGDNDIRLFGETNSLTTNHNTLLRLDISGDNEKIQYNTNTSSWLDVAAITDGAWQNVTFVFQNQQMTTYINGLEKPTKTGCKLDYSSFDLRIGGQWQSQVGWHGDTYCGLMDDISVWNGVLTQTEVTALAAGISPVPVPEPATWCGLIVLLLGGFFLRRRGC